MANPSNSPNRETSLPMAPGSAAQAQNPGPGQGGRMVNREAWLTMMDSERKGESDPKGYSDGDDA